MLSFTEVPHNKVWYLNFYILIYFDSDWTLLLLYDIHFEVMLICSDKIFNSAKTT